MCGIAGYILKKSQDHCRQVGPLFKSIVQRGPDDQGVCLINREKPTYKQYSTPYSVNSIQSTYPNYDLGNKLIDNDAAFIHNRYAIIDLSDKGHQPFVSQDKKSILIFNGEIYNYLELRLELQSEGIKCLSMSDTEVLMEGYRVWKDKLWEKLNGFWAIVLCDMEEEIIVFSRDRIGVAPLYYLENEEGLFFASSIQSLVDVSMENLTVNHDVVLGYAQTSIKDHDNTTFYKEINSFPAASNVYMPFSYKTIQNARIKKYWNLPEKRLTSSQISFEDAVQSFRDLFFSSVELRLRADVKVAFELSGGLDSSSVVAAASTMSDANITTYTVKVEESVDANFAKYMLDKYSLDYNLLPNIEGDFIHRFDEFSRVMEEPYDNPNNFTHNIMLQKMKKNGVHVVVTGAGGDEVLAGYEASFWPKAYQELSRSGGLKWLKSDIYEFCRRFMTPQKSYQTIRHYIEDSLRYIKKKSVGKRVPKKSLRRTKAFEYAIQYPQLSFHEQTLYHFNTALLPYYMRSSDHFTMGIPVEHRFPFLDYRIVEFGLQMPIEYLFHNGWTKFILRKALEPYLPKEIVWRRKKTGFYFPYQKYLQRHKSTFDPILNELVKINFPIEEFDTYNNLAAFDPVMLWRLISIGIWVSNQVEGYSKITL